jgi:Lon protease-like protein
MSAAQAASAADPTTPRPSSPSKLDTEAAASAVQDILQDEPLRGDQIRRVLRLIQCPICDRAMVSAITLPCGRSLCQACLPETHTRQDISYPGTTRREQGLTCPFAECESEHSLVDCGADVYLRNVLEIIHDEAERASKTAEVPISTVVMEKLEGFTKVSTVATESEMTGNQERPEAQPQQVLSSKFLTTWSLAMKGLIPRDAELCFDDTWDADCALQLDVSIIKKVESRLRVELECRLCLFLYLDPQTTPCGHTFCRHCLGHLADHTRVCPVCRGSISELVMADRTSWPTNAVLDGVLHTFWPKTMAQRRLEVLQDSDAAAGSSRIPIFVCCLSTPFMPTYLHVFEPRYRAMIRRAMAGNRQFGMVLMPDGRNPDGTDFMPIGTVLRIDQLRLWPDGRSWLVTVGLDRFRIRSVAVAPDGYLEAETEPIRDIGLMEEEDAEAREVRHARESSRANIPSVLTPTPAATSIATTVPAPTPTPTPTSTTASTTANTAMPTATPTPSYGAAAGQQQPHEATQPATARALPATPEELDALLTRELFRLAQQFVEGMRGAGAEWLTTNMALAYGPAPDDPALFPWWFAMVLPLTEQKRYELLATTSVRQRLKTCCAWIMKYQSG